MLVYIQWTRENPQGWEPYDINGSVDVRKLPSKDEPVGGETIDDQPGWIQAIMYQGVTIMGFDHYHPRMNPTNPLLIDLVAWNDDPDDFPVGMRWGVVWSFANPRTDPRVGVMNTEQYLKVYDEQERPAGWYGNNTTGGPVEYYPWTDFDVPSQSNMNRHGIWVPSDCENCPHTDEEHVTTLTGSACSFDDCTGYDSLHRRHIDAIESTPHSWKEWIV